MVVSQYRNVVDRKSEQELEFLITLVQPSSLIRSPFQATAVHVTGPYLPPEKDSLTFSTPPVLEFSCSRLLQSFMLLV